MLEENTTKSSNDTKQRLINVTRQMIDANGIDSVNMRDLGEKMNLSRSAVYVYFKNKEDLLAAIATEDFRIIKSRLCTLVEERDDPKKLIYEIFSTFYDFGVKNQEHYQLMFRKQWSKEEYPDLHISAFELYGVIQKCFEKAQAQKCTINKSPKQLTAMVSAFIVGLVELNSAGHLESEKGFDDPSGLIHSFVDLIFV